MKRIFIGIAAAALALSLAGCGSTKALDWQGREFGKDIPKWADALANGTEDEIKAALADETKGKVIMPLKGEGKDRDLVFAYLEMGEALPEFSRRMSVSAGFDGKGGVSGDKDEADTAAKVTEKISHAFSRNTFRGLEKLKSFWTLVRTVDGGSEYRCFVLYGMDEKLYESHVKAVLDKVKKEQPLSDRESAMLEKAEQNLQRLKVLTE